MKRIERIFSIYRFVRFLLFESPCSLLHDHVCHIVSAQSTREDVGNAGVALIHTVVERIGFAAADGVLRTCHAAIEETELHLIGVRRLRVLSHILILIAEHVLARTVSLVCPGGLVVGMVGDDTEAFHWVLVLREGIVQVVVGMVETYCREEQQQHERQDDEHGKAQLLDEDAQKSRETKDAAGSRGNRGDDVAGVVERHHRVGRCRGEHEECHAHAKNNQKTDQPVLQRSFYNSFYIHSSFILVRS